LIVVLVIYLLGFLECLIDP